MALNQVNPRPVWDHDDSTIYTAMTPPETVAADVPDHPDPLGGSEPSSYMVPWPGSTYIIRSISTGQVLTLLEGQVVLAQLGGRGSIHWECVENKGWLGFRNSVSGNFLGHDKEGRLCCAKNWHCGWENFCARMKPEGGCVLLMTHFERLWHVGIKMEKGVEKLAKIGDGADDGIAWEFCKGGRQKVVICGAGPVGALAALYAAERGDDVHVYEMREDLRDPTTTPLNFTKSINLALSERGINAMRNANHYDLLEKIFADAIPMRARMIHGKKQNGELFEESQQYDANGRSIKAVDRGGLNKCLLDALNKRPNVTFHFRHKLTGANFDKKIAWFEQLEPKQKAQTKPVKAPENRPPEVEVRFDLCIGADGAHSATRYHMMKYARLSYQQEYIDTLWCEFQIKPTKTNDFAISPNHLHIWPAGSFMFIAIPSSDRSFTCTLFAPAEHFESISKDLKVNLPAFFDTYFPGVCKNLIPESDLLDQFQNNPHLPLISIKCSPHHYSSSAVILGDAAHAMVPFYGQGMNAGLEDVRVLFSYLDSHGVYSSATQTNERRTENRKRALDAYTKQRVQDAHTINDLALQNYQEMSSNVRSPLYKLRKSLEETISVWIPWSGWRTQYTRVSFENQPYSEVERDVRKQGNVLLAAIAVGCLSVGGLGILGLRRMMR